MDEKKLLKNIYSLFDAPDFNSEHVDATLLQMYAVKNGSKLLHQVRKNFSSENPAALAALVRAKKDMEIIMRNIHSSSH